MKDVGTFLWSSLMVNVVFYLTMWPMMLTGAANPERAGWIAVATWLLYKVEVSGRTSKV